MSELINKNQQDNSEHRDLTNELKRGLLNMDRLLQRVIEIKK